MLERLGLWFLPAIMERRLIFPSVFFLLARTVCTCWPSLRWTSLWWRSSLLSPGTIELFLVLGMRTILGKIFSSVLALWQGLRGSFITVFFWYFRDLVLMIIFCSMLIGFSFLVVNMLSALARLRATKIKSHKYSSLNVSYSEHFSFMMKYATLRSFGDMITYIISSVEKGFQSILWINLSCKVHTHKSKWSVCTTKLTNYLYNLSY